MGTVTPEDRALAALVAVLVDGGQAPAAPIERVRRHGIAPLAHRHGRAELRNDFITSSLRAEQHRAIAAEAVAALAGASIPAVLLKGISYGAWLYDDPGERPMTDVDLLVPVAAHAEAIQILARLGYRHAGPRAQWSSRHHAITLKRPTGSVDLHRGPVQQGRIAIDLGGVWGRTVEAPWVPGALRLDELDETLFHFANLARHDLIAPLLSFVDAGRLLRRLDGTGWGRLHERASAWRFRRVFSTCLSVVEHVIGWRERRTPRWLPSKAEVLRGGLPPRPVQLARKLLLLEGPRELAALGITVADGLLNARPTPGNE